MAGLLSNIINLFKGKGESVLGIDVGTSAIKVVQLRRKAGRAILETYGEVALGPYASVEVGRATRLDSAKLAEALVDVLRESNVTTKVCGASIPIASSLITVIEVPNVPIKDMSQVISMEARKYVPVAMSEVTLDWRLIPSEREQTAVPVASPVKRPMFAEPVGATGTTVGRVEALVVAIHNDVINKYSEVMRRAGVDCGFFELEVFSTMRATVADQNNPVLLFDMGASSTKLYIVEHDVVRASHIINLGAQDVTLSIARSINVNVAEAERLKRSTGITTRNPKGQLDTSEATSSSLSYVFSEVIKMMESYQRKYGKIIGEVILCGGSAHMKGLIEMATEKLPARVHVADPFTKVGAPAFMSDILTEVGPEFAVAIGVALRRLQEMD